MSEPGSQADSARVGDAENSERLAAPSADGDSDSLDDPCVVVGLGASAGGLESFGRFFDAMPNDPGIAFVLIQHFDPTRESLAAELIGRHTGMSVVQAAEGQRIEPNHVYVIPPNKTLTIRDQRLQLTEATGRGGSRFPIDDFFRSLAESHRERAIGVILSGTGRDGALGAREVKARGGMVMAEDPETAAFDGMPRSAVDAGVVDYALPSEQMPIALLQHVRHRTFEDKAAEQGDPPETPDSTSKEVVRYSPQDQATILGLIRARAKHDFSGYKKGTLSRRIERRMGLRRLSDVRDYIELLRSDKSEVHALHKDLLIGVTSFFRDPDAWEALRELVIRPLVGAMAATREDAGTQGRVPPRDSIRAWSAGCATGEEAYTLAVLVAEELQAAESRCNVSVFASDIDQEALARARSGTFHGSIAADVSPELLRRFFREAKTAWVVNKGIREAVVFAEQNVLSDPPFSRLDLICCRNLLIYLEPEMQRKVLSLFHFALREGGCLFLGNAETVSQQKDLFEVVSRKWRIYRRIDAASRDITMPSHRDGRPPVMMGSPPVTAEHRVKRLPAAAQQLILQRYAPACALVDRDLNVRYLHGPTDDYLQLPNGVLTNNLVAMARQGLRTKLRAALLRAIQQDKPQMLEGARVRRGQQYHAVRVTIEPLRQRDDLADLLLVAFDEASADQRVRLVYLEQAEPVPTDQPETVSEYHAMVRHLEMELSETREDLQNSIEQFETGHEEFKAAHEEVTSINEELQATIEELETSKEELQSLNEELQTVNTQLEAKIDEVALTNDDLNNVLSSIDHAILILDREHRVRRFTPAVTLLLRVIGADVGRPFNDFAKNFTDENLLADAEKVLLNLRPNEKEIQDHNQRWYLRRIVPYRTEDDRIDGVVITFIDVTERKRAEAKINEHREQLETLVTQRTEVLRLVHDVTVASNRSSNFSHALLNAMQRVCRYNGWHGAHAYFLDPEDKTLLNPSDLWHAAAGRDLSRLRRATSATRYRVPEISLVSDAYRTAEVQWATGATAVDRLARGGGVDLGVGACVAIPIKLHSHVELVVEFFSADRIELSRESIDTMQDVAYQLESVLMRTNAVRQMIETSREERLRLGRELHDSLGQQLSGVALLVEAMRDEPNEAAAEGRGELLDKVQARVEHSLRQIRSILNGLSPVDVSGGGLPAALRRLASEAGELHGLDVRCEIDEGVTAVDAFTATQLYLIASEATHNAVKHANASEILIRMTLRDGLAVSVTDNGSGLPPAAERPAGRMGLRIMCHRADLIGASVQLETPPSGGTAVHCTVHGLPLTPF